MDEISRLIQEAKPLYFARKKRNNQIKGTLAMLVCVIMVSMFYPQTSSLVYDDWLLDETYFADNTSVIEDMGLPVDEYGFLEVC